MDTMRVRIHFAEAARGNVMLLELLVDGLRLTEVDSTQFKEKGWLTCTMPAAAFGLVSGLLRGVDRVVVVGK